MIYISIFNVFAAFTCTFNRERADVETVAHMRVCGEQKEVIINYKWRYIGRHLWKRNSNEQNNTHSKPRSSEKCLLSDPL